MRVELPAYPAVKPLPGSLFGSVPAAWRPIRLKFAMPHVTVGIVITPSKYYVDDGVPAIRSLNVKEGRLTDEDLVFFSDEDNRKLAKTRIYKDDVVIVRTGQTGSCAVVDERFNGANCIDLIIVRKSRHLRSKFLQYFLASGEAAAEITMSSNGAIQQHFNIGLVREIGLLQPSIEEQDAVLTFLDRETAKIDRLVEVRRKQVECLQEQRTAVIHHAVTKGLDPHAKMKPSGIEWLDDIPEGWRIYRLKFSAKIKNGQDYKLVESDSGYPVMGSGGQFAYATTYMHDGESVLFGRKGTINKPLYMNGKFWTVDTMFYTQIKPVIAPRFLYYCAVGFPFEYYSTQTALPSMTQQDIGNHPLAVPDLDEQQRIIVHIENETAKLDTLIAKYERELELLAEYRASLISHVVTGKVDVRGLVEPIQLDAP